MCLCTVASGGVILSMWLCSRGGWRPYSPQAEQGAADIGHAGQRAAAAAVPLQRGSRGAATGQGDAATRQGAAAAALPLHWARRCRYTASRAGRCCCCGAAAAVPLHRESRAGSCRGCAAAAAVQSSAGLEELPRDLWTRIHMAGCGEIWRDVDSRSSSAVSTRLARRGTRDTLGSADSDGERDA